MATRTSPSRAESRLAPIPAFTPPADPADPLPVDSQQTPPPMTDQPPHPPGWFEPITRSPAGEGILTGTSSGGEPSKADLKLTAELVAGLLGIGIAVAGAAVWWFGRDRGVRLREPTKTHTADMAEPLGAILARHIDPTYLNKDLVDATRFAAAVGGYLKDGPLLLADRPNSGVPADIQETS